MPSKYNPHLSEFVEVEEFYDEDKDSPEPEWSRIVIERRKRLMNATILFVADMILWTALAIAVVLGPVIWIKIAVIILIMAQCAMIAMLYRSNT